MQNSKIRKEFFIFLVLLFLTGNGIILHSQSAAKDGLTVVSSDISGITLNYKPVVTGMETIIAENGEKVLLPKILGAKVIYSKAGEPVQVVYQINITVPSPDGFALTLANVTDSKTYSGKIAPTPKFIYHHNATDEIYSPDLNAYRQPFIEKTASLNYSGIARDRHVAALKIIAARYNPSSNSVEIPDEVNINVAFSPSSSSLQVPKQTLDFGNFTINHNETSAWRVDTPRNPVIDIKHGNDKLTSLNGPIWLKISIENEGLYVIDASALSALGFTITKDEISTIKIYGDGGDNLSERISDALLNKMNEQSIIVRTNPNGDLQNIIFYGAPSNGFKYVGDSFKSYFNHYSNVNYYLLTWGGSQGKRAQFTEKTTLAPINKPVTYQEQILFFEEKNNAFIGGSGKVWFGSTIFPRNFTNMLYNLDRSGEVSYRFFVSHRSDSNGEFIISESKTKIADESLISSKLGSLWDATGKIISAKTPAANVSADNRSILTLSYTNPAITTASAFFNWMEIYYPRSFVPVNNQMGFFTDPKWEGVNEFTINSFTSGEILGFDVTDRVNPILLKNNATTGGMFIFKDSLSPGSPRRYFVSSSFNSPKIEKTEFGNYRETKYNSELVVITHPSLLQSANKYKDYREKNFPVKVSVFRTDYIYNEFASGISDPTAIRDFLANAFATWDVKPKYVLLWGDGHYDYKNIQSQTVNYIPTFESEESPDTFDATRSYSSDDFFARIAGNDMLIDVAIGRITVDDPKRGDWMVDKIIGYEQKSSNDGWRSVITLLADDSRTNDSSDGNVHTNQSEMLSTYYVPQDIIQRKIYLADYPAENVSNGRRKPKVTADMLSVINTTGTLMLNWIGHGNPRVWAHEEILDRDKTIPMMKNQDKLFFTTAATCDFGRFDMPDLKCGAEELLLSSQGGAIGVLSACRVVYSGENEQMNQEIFNQIYIRNSSTGKYRTLGDIYFSVKQKMTDLNDQKYFLLGDPYLSLHIPNNTVQIDSINGHYVGNNLDTVKIKALSKVRISGRILKPGSPLIDDTFNGNAVLTIFDGDLDYDTKDDYDNTIYHIIKFGGALNRNSTTITNGYFSSTCIIPEDISYQKKTGRINAYALSGDNRFAKGGNRSFILNGLDTSNIGSDKTGPDINIFLDDTTSFKSGDIVCKKPLLIINLADESGINATGNGIGHRIEAWFDDNPNSTDLTDKFITSLTDSRYGSAEQYLFDLKPGLHKVKVRAWDVFNNFSVAEAYFRILPDGDGIVITNVNSFPNPFNDRTVIRFEHNLSQLFKAELNIYSPEGRLIKTISDNLNSVHTSELLWNGTDNNGMRVSTGAYIYEITVRTIDGMVARKHGIAALVN